MTDFGRRMGVGDMLKADYDPILAAIAATLADHHTQHENGGTDEIDATGLVGAGGAGILGNGTAGRVFRAITLMIENGTNANTLRCSTLDAWNGDVIAAQDNVAKNATTGHFKLNTEGTILEVLNAGLTGNVVFAMGELYNNATTTEFIGNVVKSTDGIRHYLLGLSDGTLKDMTPLVDVASYAMRVQYITDA